MAELMDNMWNRTAEFYNRFTKCEYADTELYLDEVGLLPSDTVLDVCCGTGRISVLAAKRVKSVTAFDSAELMLGYARENAEEMGVDNVDFRLLDFDDVVPGENMPVHDVVIASRCGALGQVEKLSKLARRMVVLQIFADAPAIPNLTGMLFEGCGESRMPNRPSRKDDLGYLRFAVRAHDLGYTPNVRAMPERFRKTFATEEEAVDFVCSLNPDRAEGNRDRIALNLQSYLTKIDDGVEFCIATRAAIIWWEV